MLIGWRPHDHGIPYSPAGHGVGVQQGFSDPTFMARFGLEARHEHPPFPYDQEDIRRRAARGDPAALQAMMLGSKWVGEIASGIFRSWDEIQFIRDNWDGQIVLKGILAPEVGVYFGCARIPRMALTISNVQSPSLSTGRMLRKRLTWELMASSSLITVCTVIDIPFFVWD